MHNNIAIIGAQKIMKTNSNGEVKPIANKNAIQPSNNMKLFQCHDVYDH